MFDVLSNGTPLSDVITASPVANLDVAPSRIALAKLESQMVGEIDAHFRLKDRLEAVKDRYEFVVVDTPPALGLITVNALVAATHLLIPVQSSYFALEGTDDLLETVEKIRSRPNPNPNQPRQRMGDLTELVASVREKGILEPILVRPAGSRFQIIAGERRYRAAVEAGLAEIPCIVRDSSDAEAMEIALVENLQRKDL